AGRSKYCIIDTTNCDPTYCGVLGLAFGYRRRVLNIYEQNRPGLITNYAGQNPKEYADKEQLIHNIRKFVAQAKPRGITEEDAKWIKEHIDEFFKKRGEQGGQSSV
ncbi:unnamed protein product, partial [marine sediment metagenome]